MRSTLLIALVTLATAPFATGNTAKSQGPNVAGLYACEGRSPEGQAYHGTVEIVQREDTYRIRWSIEGNEGVMHVVGVGIFSDGVLAASYFGGAPGIAVYKPDGTKKLVGRWTIGGADGAIYPETLTRIADRPAPRPEPHDAPPPSRRPASVRPAVATFR